MKRRRTTLQLRSIVAVAVAIVWLPFQGTRCYQGPAGSTNCIFGHHEAHESSADHHHGHAHGIGGSAGTGEPVQDHHAAASGDAGKRHGHQRDDTCCTQTGKCSVIPSAAFGPEPLVAVAAVGSPTSYLPALVGHPERCTLAPVAHSPPIYLRNATLLI